MSLYRFVDYQRAYFGVEELCRVCEVSRSAYYDWCGRGRRDEAADDQRLVREIREIHAVSGRTYGSPRVSAELRRRGWCVNHKRVERLMRCHGIVGTNPPRRRQTTFPDRAHRLPDLVAGDFVRRRPDAVWCGDITYISTEEGWLYLAVVIDVGSRRVIGYSMAGHLRAQLVTDALEAAVACRGGHAGGVVFHSDRGVQYTSRQFAARCARLGIRQSVGRTGICWDNALVESFFASLKKELVHQRSFRSHARARRAIFRYIESWYNRRRLHSTLNYTTPIEWELRYSPNTNPQAA